MPFVFVWGIPENATDTVLLQLRRNIILSLIETMKVDPGWVRVFFPRDLLNDPAQPEDGNNTIYMSIETGMFYSEPENSLDPKGVTQAIAHIVWQTFEGQYEVECFIGNHNPSWVSLIHAKS